MFELAWTHSQVVLRQLDATEADTQLYGRLASSILYANPLLRAAGSVIARNRRGQSGLWGYGISGDLPIVLLRIGDQAQISLVRQLVQAHAYWRVKGLAVDLVIWNEDQSGYRQVLQDQIMGVIASRAEANLLDRAGRDLRPPDRADVRGGQGPDADGRPGDPERHRRHARRAGGPPRRAEVPVPRVQPRRASAGPRSPDRGGGAAPRPGGVQRHRRVHAATAASTSSPPPPSAPTPAPWVNVLANPWFGTVVSESGGAYTWCENAHAYRLTPWNNDPVSDASGEAFYIRDEDTGRFWSPTPLPARGPMPYTTRHGFGYSIFEYTEDGITTEMWTYVATDAPVKFIVVKLRNSSGAAAAALGDRASSSWCSATHRPGEPAARRHRGRSQDRGAAWPATPTTASSASASRSSTPAKRSAPSPATAPSSSAATEHRPTPPACTAPASRAASAPGSTRAWRCRCMVELADGQEREVAFTFGSGRDLADARNLVSRFRGTGPARAALEGVWGYWNRTLGAVHVQTPDASLNFLANGWLLYQVLACRLWGRSGFYQSGGAFGFRDQLQDAMALVHAEPGILREQLLRSAAQQFREGDVQHWWHPPSGRGVRTRISDDYLWLPYAACRYVAALGDTGVLDEKIQFLDGRPVKPDEESYYDLPARVRRVRPRSTSTASAPSRTACASASTACRSWAAATGTTA